MDPHQPVSPDFPGNLGTLFDELALAGTSKILEKVITLQGVPDFPKVLYHYTSLSVAQKILEKDDVRLSQAEYSNDQTEMNHAKSIVANVLGTPRQNTFLAAVKEEYERLAVDLDAYVFCMSNFDDGSPRPQDRLSQWRAYGQDGRGVCLSIDARRLAHIVYHTPGLKINPVFYDPIQQCQFMGAIIEQGEWLNQSGHQSAIRATVGALVAATPLMKAQGFSEELEWRLIFMPPSSSSVQPTVEFHPRRDFLTPFLRLKYIWKDLRPLLAKNPAFQPHPPSNVPFPSENPLLPIIGIMVGPSIHKSLNQRSIAKLLTQNGWPAVRATESNIPYRSID